MADKRDDVIFDYRLGYVRVNCDLEGFNVLGTDGAPRIVILGGYTSAEQANAGVTWADYLFKLFQANDSPVQILNGDTDGFTSAQEMLMLIRDGILLKPKLVICLSGFYNFCYKLGFVREREYVDTLRKYPFTNPEQLMFYNEITSRFGLGYDKMYYGEEINTPAWEYWLLHQDIMYCLCKEFGIKYMSFLQPCIFSGTYKASEYETSILRKMYGLKQNDIEVFHNDFCYIYERVSEGIKSRDYITDISSLFDNDSNVFIDACHIKDEYTQKISQVIYNKTSGLIAGDGGTKK